jgi:hypothetical protein
MATASGTAPRSFIGAGSIIDVTYGTPPDTRTWRVSVVSHDEGTGWHKVSSKGLSVWDGEMFTDEIDVNAMWARGLIAIVREARPSGAAALGQSSAGRGAATARRGRGRGSSTATGSGTARAAGTAKAAGANSSSTAATAKAVGARRRVAAEKPVAGAGRAGAKSRKSSVTPVARAQPGAQWGAELVGQVLDVTYFEMVPPRRYRVRVTGINKAKGWHFVDSTGLSAWDGVDFTDALNINDMWASGHVSLVPPLLPGVSTSLLPGVSASSTVAKAPPSRAPAVPRTASRGNSVEPSEPKRPRGKPAAIAAPVAGSTSTPSEPRFGPDSIGSIIDLSYKDPPMTFRVKIVKFMPKLGVHVVDSKGLSLWDGDTFTDRVHLNFMDRDKQVKLISKPVLMASSADRAERKRKREFR